MHNKKWYQTVYYIIVFISMGMISQKAKLNILSVEMCFFYCKFKKSPVESFSKPNVKTTFCNMTLSKALKGSTQCYNLGLSLVGRGLIWFFFIILTHGVEALSSTQLSKGQDNSAHRDKQ